MRPGNNTDFERAVMEEMQRQRAGWNAAPPPHQAGVPMPAYGANLPGAGMMGMRPGPGPAPPGPHGMHRPPMGGPPPGAPPPDARWAAPPGQGRGEWDPPMMQRGPPPGYGGPPPGPPRQGAPRFPARPGPPGAMGHRPDPRGGQRLFNEAGPPKNSAPGGFLPAHEERRRQAQQRAAAEDGPALGMLGADPRARSRAKQQERQRQDAYRRELEAQIEQRKAREAQEKQARQRQDASLARGGAAAVWANRGTGGGGEPHRSPESFHAAPPGRAGPGQENLAPPPRAFGPGQGVPEQGLVQQQRRARYQFDQRDPNEQQQIQRKKARQRKQAAALRKQMEEKKRRDEVEKRKRRQQDEQDELRMARERQVMLQRDRYAIAKERGGDVGPPPTGDMGMGAGGLQVNTHAANRGPPGMPPVLVGPVPGKPLSPMGRRAQVRDGNAPIQSKETAKRRAQAQAAALREQMLLKQQQKAEALRLEKEREARDEARFRREREEIARRERMEIARERGLPVPDERPVQVPEWEKRGPAAVATPPLQGEPQPHPGFAPRPGLGPGPESSDPYARGGHDPRHAAAGMWAQPGGVPGPEPGGWQAQAAAAAAAAAPPRPHAAENSEVAELKAALEAQRRQMAEMQARFEMMQQQQMQQQYSPPPPQQHIPFERLQQQQMQQMQQMQQQQMQQQRSPRQQQMQRAAPRAGAGAQWGWEDMPLPTSKAAQQQRQQEAQLHAGGGEGRERMDVADLGMQQEQAEAGLGAGANRLGGIGVASRLSTVQEDQDANFDSRAAMDDLDFRPDDGRGGVGVGVGVGVVDPLEESMANHSKLVAVPANDFAATGRSLGDTRGVGLDGTAAMMRTYRGGMEESMDAESFLVFNANRSQLQASRRLADPLASLPEGDVAELEGDVPEAEAEADLARDRGRESIDTVEADEVLRQFMNEPDDVRDNADKSASDADMPSEVPPGSAPQPPSPVMVDAAPTTRARKSGPSTPPRLSRNGLSDYESPGRRGKEGQGPHTPKAARASANRLRRSQQRQQQQQPTPGTPKGAEGERLKDEEEGLVDADIMPPPVVVRPPSTGAGVGVVGAVSPHSPGRVADSNASEESKTRNGGGGASKSMSTNRGEPSPFRERPRTAGRRSSKKGARGDWKTRAAELLSWEPRKSRSSPSSSSSPSPSPSKTESARKKAADAVRRSRAEAEADEADGRGDLSVEVAAEDTIATGSPLLGRGANNAHGDDDDDDDMCNIGDVSPSAGSPPRRSRDFGGDQDADTPKFVVHTIRNVVSAHTSPESDSTAAASVGSRSPTPVVRRGSPRRAHGLGGPRGPSSSPRRGLHSAEDQVFYNDSPSPFRDDPLAAAAQRSAGRRSANVADLDDSLGGRGREDEDEDEGEDEGDGEGDDEYDEDALDDSMSMTQWRDDDDLADEDVAGGRSFGGGSSISSAYRTKSKREQKHRRREQALEQEQRRQQRMEHLQQQQQQQKRRPATAATRPQSRRRRHADKLNGLNVNMLHAQPVKLRPQSSAVATASSKNSTSNANRRGGKGGQVRPGTGGSGNRTPLRSQRTQVRANKQKKKKSREVERRRVRTPARGTTRTPPRPQTAAVASARPGSDSITPTRSYRDAERRRRRKRQGLSPRDDDEEVSMLIETIKRPYTAAAAAASHQQVNARHRERGRRAKDTVATPSPARPRSQRGDNRDHLADTIKSDRRRGTGVGARAGAELRAASAKKKKAAAAAAAAAMANETMEGGVQLRPRASRPEFQDTVTSLAEERAKHRRGVGVSATAGQRQRMPEMLADTSMSLRETRDRARREAKLREATMSEEEEEDGYNDMHDKHRRRRPRSESKQRH